MNLRLVMNNTIFGLCSAFVLLLHIRFGQFFSGKLFLHGRVVIFSSRQVMHFTSSCFTIIRKHSHVTRFFCFLMLDWLIDWLGCFFVSIQHSTELPDCQVFTFNSTVHSSARFSADYSSPNTKRKMLLNIEAETVSWKRTKEPKKRTMEFISSTLWFPWCRRLLLEHLQ